jgi:hypothetical protein
VADEYDEENDQSRPEKHKSHDNGVIRLVAI